MAITRSPIKSRKRVIVRFAGDSGDGMQLAGSRFTEATAEHGNDFATLPSFPAEIRAPAGTLAGVSAFQIHFADADILTPGDEPDVLVAMNPAALKSELAGLARSGTVIANEDAFSKRNLQKAGYESNPLEDGSLDGYHLIRIPMTSLTAAAVEAIESVSTRDAGRAKNLFALGVVSWLYDRPTEPTEDWLRRKFVNKPGPLEANLSAFRAGWNFGETSELIDVQYKVDPATDVPAGTLAGVSAFQIHFASQDILTPGDEPDVLVAMNPAALRSELPALAPRGTVIANEDAFSKRNLQKAGYEENPLEDGSLDGYHVIRIPMTSLTASATEALEGVSTRDAGRAKNLFALGVVSWL